MANLSSESNLLYILEPCYSFDGSHVQYCPRRSTLEKREGNDIDGRQLFILFIPINKRKP